MLAWTFFILVKTYILTSLGNICLHKMVHRKKYYLSWIGTQIISETIQQLENWFWTFLSTMRNHFKYLLPWCSNVHPSVIHPDAPLTRDSCIEFSARSISWIESKFLSFMYKSSFSQTYYHSGLLAASSNTWDTQRKRWKLS